MTEIIQFDPNRRPINVRPVSTPGCRHKYVTADQDYRMIVCNICGARLDPFDAWVSYSRGLEEYEQYERRLQVEIADMEAT